MDTGGGHSEVPSPNNPEAGYTKYSTTGKDRPDDGGLFEGLAEVCFMSLAEKTPTNIYGAIDIIQSRLDIIGDIRSANLSTSAATQSKPSKKNTVYLDSESPSKIQEPIDQAQTQNNIAVASAVETENDRGRNHLVQRRNKTKPDGLEYLARSPSPKKSQRPKQRGVLRSIALCLMKLDQWILRTATDANNDDDRSLFASRDERELRRIITGKPEKSTTLEPYQGYVHQERRLQETALKLSYDQAKDRIQNRATLYYLGRMLEQRLSIKVETSKRIPRETVERVMEDVPASASNYCIDRSPPVSSSAVTKYYPTPPRIRSRFRLQRFSEDSQITIARDLQATAALVSVVETIKELSHHIDYAACRDCLDAGLNGALEDKMVALDNSIGSACTVLGLPSQKLVWPHKVWWKPPNTPSTVFMEPTEHSPGEIELQNPSLKAEDYMRDCGALGTSSMLPTLSFIVPVISILTSIPAALAWAHSTHEIGSIHDADFYQLISASALQLLSIVVLVTPTFLNVRLKAQAWFFTRVLAGISATCAIAAVVLYLLVPTEWSGAISFVGSIAQALVILQLAFTL